MKKRRIIFLVYHQFELLDLSGPMSVFSTSNRISRNTPYQIIVASIDGGAVSCQTGLEIITEKLNELELSKRDTILVTGAQRKPLQNAMELNGLLVWLRTSKDKVERLGSVCTGAFLLAASGTVEQKRVATHWAASNELQKNFPKIIVDPESLYTVDGMFWTSAGVTAGIDMALAILENDLGSTLMLDVARYLVVYARRPGNQSQFSTLLQAQSAGGDLFKDIIAWIDTHIGEPIKVADMAEQACMSERSFYRRFTSAIGISPHKFLCKMRIERGRELIEIGVPIKVVARTVGYESTLGFNSAFELQYNVTPLQYKYINSRSLTS